MELIRKEQDLFAKMAQGATIVTPNNRLSHHLLEKYLSQYPIPVIKPLCFPYQAFLREQFDKVRHAYPRDRHPHILSKLQERILWFQILGDEYAWLTPDIQQAWESCRLWCLKVPQPLFSYNVQTEQYMLWESAFSRSLKKLNAITESEIADYLLSYAHIFSGKEIIWAAFDEFSPLQVQLQEQLNQSHFVQYIYEKEEEHAALTYLYQGEDEEDEFSQLMLWLQEQLNNKVDNIAVIIPDLHLKASRLQRLLLFYLNKQDFNITMGAPLSQYPLIAHAFLFLNVSKQTLTHQEALLLLESPYLLGDDWLKREEFLEYPPCLRKQIYPISNLSKQLQINYLL